jgi:hypothetical protein
MTEIMNMFVKRAENASDGLRMTKRLASGRRKGRKGRRLYDRNEINRREKPRAREK